MAPPGGYYPVAVRIRAYTVQPEAWSSQFGRPVQTFAKISKRSCVCKRFRDFSAENHYLQDIRRAASGRLNFPRQVVPRPSSPVAHDGRTQP